VFRWTSKKGFYMSIDNLLKTEQGAISVKEKLKGMSAKEKQSPNYKLLWSKACAAVNQLNQGKKQQKVKPKVDHKNNFQVKPKDKPKSQPLKKEELTKRKNIISLSPDQYAINLNKLITLYPLLFSETDPKPLNIGIHTMIDIYKLQISETLLSSILIRYVRQESYLLSVFKYKKRYDLDGNPMVDITNDEINHTKKSLARTIGRFKMLEKYPDLYLKPEAIQPKFKKNYGTHYYAKSAKEELVYLIHECYGRYHRGRYYKEPYSEAENIYLYRLSLPNKELEIRSSPTKDRRIGEAHASKKALIYLQKHIDAYPFAYQLPNKLEDEILLK
jgi:hypothetical protein